MATGLLEVAGTLASTQFWSNGTSDADTAQVTVSAFYFDGRVTRAFDGATVKRSAHAKTGRPVLNKKGEVTVRFQGIDAPELHYQPTFMNLAAQAKSAVAKANGTFRQHLGETAAQALGKLVNGLGPNPIACLVRSRVSHPSDVFDMFGRLIGDVFVQVGHQQINLNHWLLQHGQAFPTFYDSMTEQEIADIEALVKHAQEANAGIWAHYSADATEFDERLLAPRAHATFSADRDAGAVSMPKLFRRASSWSVLKKSGLKTTSFVAYLKAHPDTCFTTAAFLTSGTSAKKRKTSLTPVVLS
jgi:endonuclease YncB( thermonuclease family)